MARGFRLALLAALVLLAGASAFVIAARQGLFRPDETELRARYGLPGSRFERVGRYHLHYVDEGKGPVVMLVHGSYASLRMYDRWAEALARRYRVVRFDRPRMGLSAPSPDGRADGETDARVIRALADHLGIDKMVLVGTSSSGESVARFAARYPERTSAVVLANIAAGPIAPAPTHFPAWFQVVLMVDPWFGGWHPRAFWRGILEQNFADRTRVSDRLVREWTDLNNLPQGSPVVRPPDARPPFSDTPDDLAAIRAPALVLWSDSDPEVPLETHGRDTLRLLGSSDKSLVVMPRCGHMMPLECGDASAASLQAFLDRAVIRD